MKPAIIVPIAVALIGGAAHIGAELVKDTKTQPPPEKLAQTNVRPVVRNANEQASLGSSSANSNGNGAKASGSSFDRACAAYAGPVGAAVGATSTCSKADSNGNKSVSTFSGPDSARGNGISN